MVTLEAREGHDAEVRRDGVERLAAASRALADAIAVTAVDRPTLDEVSGAATYLTWTLRPTSGGTAVRLRVDETDAYAGCEEDLEDIWLPVLERLVVMLTPAAPASRASCPAL